MSQEYEGSLGYGPDGPVEPEMGTGTGSDSGEDASGKEAPHPYQPRN